MRGVGWVAGVRMGATISEAVERVGVRGDVVWNVGVCTGEGISCTVLAVVPVSKNGSCAYIEVIGVNAWTYSISQC